MNDPEQTKRVFKEKWENHSQLGYDDIMNINSEITGWILQRNGWKSYEDLSDFLSLHPKILDAGCGNGRVTALFSKLAPNNSVTGFDINPEIAIQNLSENDNVQIVKHDLMNVSNERFDFIYSQEVLHHVENPKKAFENLVDSLNTGGVIAIYVYKKKSAIREYTDEYIRGLLLDMDYRVAIKLMSEVSDFGKALTDLNANVKIDGVELLDIPAGTYSVQRLFYHFFFKCFWNSGLTKSENDAINFDWYGPQIASKHTSDEILSWFEESNLQVSLHSEDEYGITVHGQKI